MSAAGYAHAVHRPVDVQGLDRRRETLSDIQQLHLWDFTDGGGR